MFFLVDNQGRQPGKPDPKAMLDRLMARIGASDPVIPGKRPTGPEGCLYYLPPPDGIDLLVQWLVVATGKGRICLVPVDDHPFAGYGDVRLQGNAVAWPMTARCQMACWLPESILAAGKIAGHLPDPMLAQVRSGLRGLSPLAGGPPPVDPEEDWDGLELEEHLKCLSRFLDDLLARSGPVPVVEPAPVILSVVDHFRPGYPRECRNTGRGLAAAGPDWLMDELEEMEAGAGSGSSTLERPLTGGITLVLMANGRGILPALRGTGGPGECPVLTDLLDEVGARALDWEPASGLMVSSRRIPWREGRVVLELPDGKRLELKR